MKLKTILTVAAFATLLMGCAQTEQYPITGIDVGAHDHVKFMAAPDVARY